MTTVQQKISAIWFLAILALLGYASWLFTETALHAFSHRQRHYIVSYKYQTPRVAPNLESTQWGYGHVQLNTDFDLFTQYGVSNAVTYIRDKFIPANDGPSNACVVLQWFTKID